VVHAPPGLHAIQAALRAFRDARGWAPLHTPKDLAAAISIEAAELQELYLWRAPNEGAISRERVGDELADVIIYCLHLADVEGVDVVEAIRLKIAKNEARFPVKAADE
jgi:NTP pyrophosphatase (non-canonical NTP hydrolase)